MRRLAYSALSPRRRTLLDLLLLFLLCLLFFWRDLPLAGVDYRGFAAGDFGNQFYAFASYKAARLHAGQLPLWSPYALSGHPFLADIQSAVFYPPGLLTMLVTAATGFSYAALQIEAVLHLPLAAVGMYLLGLRLTGSRLGAWVAALVFTFGAYLTGYPLLQLAILETVAWLPFIVLTLDLAVDALAAERSRGALGWALVAGLLMGVALLAGHPQSAMFVFYGSIAFALFRYFSSNGNHGGRGLWRIAGLLGIFALAAGGLAAAQLLPALEYMRLSTRSGLGIDATGGGLTPYDLLQLVLPQISAPFAALYVGALPLGLAIYAVIRIAIRPSGLVSSKERGLARYLSGLTLVSLLLSFGALTPLYQAAYLLVPGWRLFRQQERIAVWIVFGLALLAGLGAAVLERRQEQAQASGVAAGERRWLYRGYWAGAAVAALFAVVCFAGYLAGNDGLWGFAASGLFLALLLALAPLALASQRPAWIIALIVLDLFALNGRQHAGDATTPVVWPPAPVYDAITADDATFRVFDEDVLPGNYGYGYGLEDTNGASPLRLSAYDRLLKEARKSLLWRLLGVKYVATWRTELELPAERIAEQPGKGDQKVHVYRLATANPWFWFSGNTVVEPDRDGQIRRVLDGSFDPDQQVVLDHAPAPQPQSGCTGTAEWTARTPEFTGLQVVTDAPCILVLSDIAYPGWRARVDGNPVPVLTANAILRGVAVPAGAHRVELAFRPPLVTAGLVVSGLTLLAALALLAWAGRTGNKLRR